MEKTTISDVALNAKVSKSTVSQFLNGRYDYMSVGTKKRIETAIKELNYQPNIIARSLRIKQTSTIGVIVANILHSFSTRITRAIEDVCSEKDINVIICNADDDIKKEKKYLEILTAKQVDGIIVFPTGENIELFQELNNSSIPLVFVDRLVENCPTSSTLLDNKRAVELAIDHFIKKDYKDIGFITTSLENKTLPRIERLEAFKETLRSRNLQVIDSYIKTLDIDQIGTGLENMFQLKNPPKALLSGNDLVSLEVLRFIKKFNLRIPKDVALISFDDVAYNEIYSPPITTIAQPVEEMGQKAAEILLDNIFKKDDIEENKIHRFEPFLIIRGSC